MILIIVRQAALCMGSPAVMQKLNSAIEHAMKFIELVYNRMLAMIPINIYLAATSH